MTLAYDDSGSTGPTGSTGPAESTRAVLLLHAGVCDRRMWQTQVAALAPTYRVIAPDLPGFGNSPLEPGEFSTPGQLVELLDTLGIEATAVVGASYGGRVASLAAAEPDAAYAALVLFSYPLHPPGAPDRTAARISHWPAIRCPVLLLSGESDPFAQIELLRTSTGLLERAELVTYPRLGHTLKPVLEDVLDRAAAFLLGLPTR